MCTINSYSISTILGTQSQNTCHVSEENHYANYSQWMDSSLASAAGKEKYFE